jgi:hypothetical protein
MNDNSKFRKFLNDLKAVDLYYLPRIFLFAFILAISPLVFITELEGGFAGMRFEYLIITPLVLVGGLIFCTGLAASIVGFILLLSKFIDWTFGLDD